MTRGGARPTAGRRGRLLKRAIAVAAFAFAAFLMWRALRRYSPGELGAALAAVPSARLAGAAAFAAAAYACHTAFDYLALIYAGAPQPYARAALGSFASTSISHALDFAGATSSLLRWRFWTRWGLDGERIVKALAFCAATVVLGHVTLAGLACLAAPEIAAAATRLSVAGARALGAGCLGAAGLYLAACAVRPAALMVWGRAVRLPSPSLAVAQVAVGVANYACVAGCLAQTIAGVAPIGYPSVLAAYAASNAAAAVTRAPSGLGVLETVIQALLPVPELVGALLAFRLVYLLAPLPLGLAALAVSEALARQKKTAF